MNKGEEPRVWRRDLALKVFGSKCLICGHVYANNPQHFEFHHKVESGESSKGNSPGAWLRRKCTAEEYADYFSKTVPLCLFCHADVHHAGLGFIAPDEMAMWERLFAVFEERSKANRVKQRESGMVGLAVMNGNKKAKAERRAARKVLV